MLVVDRTVLLYIMLLLMHYCCIILYIVCPIVCAYTNELTYVKTYSRITSPRNGSICGSHVELKLDIDLSLAGAPVNFFFDDIQMCVYKNGVFFACIDGFNPRFAILCDVSFGLTTIDIYTRSLYDTAIEASHDRVTVYRPSFIVQHDVSPSIVEDVTNSDVNVVAYCSSRYRIGLPSSLEPLRMLVDSLVLHSKPFSTSVLLVADSYEANDANIRWSGVGVDEQPVDCPLSIPVEPWTPAVLLLRLAPLRLHVLVADAGADRRGVANGDALCEGLVATRVRCNFFSSDHHAVDVLPPMVHVSIMHLSVCDALSGQSSHTAAQHWLAVRSRTSGHHVSGAAESSVSHALVSCFCSPGVIVVAL